MSDRRPEPREYAPHHERYIALVPSPILPVLRAQRQALPAALLSIDESAGAHRYAPGKWSVRQVIGHLSDAERVYQSRAAAIASGHAGPLPPYDPDATVAAAGYDERSIADLVGEFIEVRDGTLALLESLPREAWERAGPFGGAAVSVRAWAHIAAGHAVQHINVLRERYGVLGAEC